MLERMNLNNNINLYKLLQDNLKLHADLSKIFDCHIIDLDIYYKYELYTKSNSEILMKAVSNYGSRYAYLVLYKTNFKGN